MPNIYSIDFFGLKLSAFENYEYDLFVDDAISNDKNVIVYGYSIGIMPKFRDDSNLATVCNSFDLLVTDGKPLYYVAKILRFNLKSSLSIPDITIRTLRLASEKGWKVMLIGGTEENNDLAVSKLRIDYPGSVISDGINGFYTDEEIIVSRIKQESPDILLVGLPTPQKEYFATRYKPLSHVIIPCGGMIDVLAGKTKLTPAFIKKLGFAWLYRFIQQPKSRFKLTVTYLFSFLFLLLPILIFLRIFRKDTDFSIPLFYTGRK